MLISFLHHFGIWILITVSLPFGHLQEVTRLSNQGPVCPGQQISFQCTTEGSAAIVWRSTDFIGSNIVQIDFVDSEPLNTPKRSMAFPDTVAVLTSKGSGVLTSMLTVTVTSVNLNPSVTCINDDLRTETTSSFHVIGVPGVPAIEETVLQEHCHTQGCLLSIYWTAVENVTHYIVSINATHEINKTLTFTSVEVPECRSYGVRVRSVNQCGDKSPYSPEILPDTENIRPLISFDSLDGFTMIGDTSVCTNPPREPCDDCPSVSVAVITVAVILFVAAFIFFVAAAVLVWWIIKSKKD